MISRRKLHGFYVTFETTHAFDLNAFENHGQLCSGDRNAGCWTLRKTESACFQTFVPDGKAVRVPIQGLDPVSTTIPEHEQMATERVVAHDMFGHHHEPVEALAHVTNFGAQVNACGRSDAQHDGVFSATRSRRSSSASNPCGM